MQQTQKCNKTDNETVLKLSPKAQPGRPNRILVAHLPEIQRLRTEGYSVPAIHGALIEAGIQVALRTVFLEVAKLTSSAAPLALEPTSSAPPITPPALPSAGKAIDPPSEASPIEKTTYPVVDIDELFKNPLNRNPFLKGRLK